MGKCFLFNISSWSSKQNCVHNNIMTLVPNMAIKLINVMISEKTEASSGLISVFNLSMYKRHYYESISLASY